MKNCPHHPLCHILLPKSQKEFFTAQKTLRIMKLLRVLSDRVILRVLSDRFLFCFLSDWVSFRFLSDGILLMVLSDRVLFKSSVIGSSKGSSEIDSFPGLAVLFFRYASTFFIKKHQKTLINFNKNDSRKHEQILAWWKHKMLYWKYISAVSQYNFSYNKSFSYK